MLLYDRLQFPVRQEWLMANGRQARPWTDGVLSAELRSYVEVGWVWVWIMELHGGFIDSKA